jgi:zinc finger protein BrlA
MLSKFTMFADQNPEYLSNIQTGSTPSCHSMSSSFSDPWETSVMTPTTPERQISSVKHGDDYAQSTTSFSITPEKFSATLEYTQFSNGPEESIQTLPTGSLPFRDMHTSSDQSFMMFNNLPEYDDILHGATSGRNIPSGAQSLDMDPYSPSVSGSSQISAECVVPSQTTFTNTLNFQSPIRAVGGMHFELSYDSSPSSNYKQEFSLDHSPAGSMSDSMTYFLPQSFENYNSSSATPQKISNFRQPIFNGLPSSAALRHVTNASLPKNQHTSVGAIARRKIKREVREVRGGMLPQNIKVQESAKFLCTWDGCPKKFARKEHLRRHEKDCHICSESPECEFCGKVFNRKDNLKQHIKIHSAPEKKASRTRYFPEAQAKYDSMNSKKRRTVHTSYFD